MNTKQRTRIAAVAAPALGLVLLLAGCGSDSPNGGSTGYGGGQAATSAPEHSMPPNDSGSQAPSEENTIVISNFKFSVPVSVKAGAIITIRNDDSVAHTVTSDAKGLFDVEIAAGAEAQLTVPSEAGTYPFHCTFHPGMTGALVVG